MGTSDQGSLGYVHVSPQVTGGVVLGLCPCVSPSDWGGWSLAYVHASPYHFVLPDITDHALCAVGIHPRLLPGPV